MYLRVTESFDIESKETKQKWLIIKSDLDASQPSVVGRSSVSVLCFWKLELPIYSRRCTWNSESFRFVRRAAQKNFCWGQGLFGRLALKEAKPFMCYVDLGKRDSCSGKQQGSLARLSSSKNISSDSKFGGKLCSLPTRENLYIWWHMEDIWDPTEETKVHSCGEPEGEYDFNPRIYRGLFHVWADT